MLKDIFGKSINPGDIVGYASSNGIFIVVVKEVVYNKNGNPLRVRMCYPSLYTNWKTNKGEEVIKNKTMHAYQQEFIKFTEEEFNHYCGKESLHGVKNGVIKMIELSHKVKGEIE